MTNYFNKQIMDILISLSPIIFLILSLWIFEKTIKNKNNLKVIRTTCSIFAILLFIIIYSKREFSIYKTEGYQKVVSDLMEMIFVLFVIKYAKEIEEVLNNTIKKLFKKNKL